ncbi:ECF RNA polymerase sigma factor SigK [Nonomuraea sp. NPDC050790]|uniref:ECF RNA polymerase sigma factor SigK n=1 Tax=Nonomuraea sp. NPDC050790 TaxID=3364371 RepID=UPI003799B003
MGPSSRHRRAPRDSDDGSGLAGLLKRSAHGDEDAFGRLYDQVSPMVYGTALRVIRDPSQAEEVAQEAMLEIWRMAARYDERKGSAIAWMATITHRKAVDRVRSAQAAATRDARAGRMAAASADYDVVVEQVEERLDRERIRRCLNRLTDLQRQSVTMAFYGGYAYAEVAHMLETPLGTIKTRMRDGLIRLRDCLGVGV